jgi:MerR family transcriptional regulator, mercuric resistance operon regulatory protein
VRLIKRAQELGFTLEEVKSLLLLEDGQSCRETRALAEHKLALIEERIADLTRMRRLLKGLMAECTRGRRPRSCPIIVTLSASAEAAHGAGNIPGLVDRMVSGRRAVGRVPLS